MPDHEQLGILCLFGLLATLYVLALGARYLIEYWYLTVTVIMSLITLRIWWRRRHPLDYEDDEWEPVIQE